MAFKNNVADDMALVGHPVWPIRLPICPRLAPRLAAHHCRTFAKPLHNHCKTITKSLQNQTGAPPSGPIGSPVCPRQVPRLPQSGPRLPPSTPIWPLSIAKALQNRCKTRRGPDGGRWGARCGARRGGGQGLFTFKRKNDMFYICVM
jgi:hypothetical protein